jgi:hypothetical protein
MTDVTLIAIGVYTGLKSLRANYSLLVLHWPSPGARSHRLDTVS